MQRPVLGREQKTPLVLVFEQTIETGDLEPAKSDHMPVDRLGTAVRVGQPAAIRAHPRWRHLVERCDRADGHHDVARDGGDPGCNGQPLASARKARIDQAKTTTCGQVDEAVARTWPAAACTHSKPARPAPRRATPRGRVRSGMPFQHESQGDHPPRGCCIPPPLAGTSSSRMIGTVIAFSTGHYRHINTAAPQKGAMVNRSQTRAVGIGHMPACCKAAQRE